MLLPARALVLVAAALALAFATPSTASAAPGQLDTTFGPLGNGLVLADHGLGDLVVFPEGSARSTVAIAATP